MKVLVIGSGGREHAITWKLAQSALNPRLFIAPGNPGTAKLGTNVPIGVHDGEGLLAFARKEGIDITVVGPEQPLVDGVVDRFEAAGLRVFGPSARAAEIEGSKAFAKAFMARHGIPTAAHQTFTQGEYEAARAYVEAQGAPIVLKASGLAAGKGVLICETVASALEGLEALMQDSLFGEAGASVVVEEYMEGEEASIFVLTDGRRYTYLAAAQDHKRIGEGDKGPNTGGMGAYAPAPIVTGPLLEEIDATIVKPTLEGMAAEGRPFKGILYTGLMMTAAGPRVVEYNCRLGDPETQVVLPLLQDDLLQLILALTGDETETLAPARSAGAAVCVVLASKGYPGSYPKGVAITGLDAAEEKDGVVVFHAGTRANASGGVETAGGRVLGVTGLGETLQETLEKTYRAVERIDFDGMQFRKDIAQKGLARQSS